MTVDPQLLELLAQMDGQILSDYCEGCTAPTEVVNKGGGMILMKITHDPWCSEHPALLADAIKRAEQDLPE